MTEFGEKEHTRLAELLGDCFTNDCRWCNSTGNRVKEFTWGISEPWTCEKCNGRGRVPNLPTGLALIEACRKRGVQISVDTFGENYEVECFQGGKFVFRTECQFEDLESAIAIAALKGLESLENTNECKVK